MTRTGTGPHSAIGEPDDYAAVDDLLQSVPEPQLAPDRFAAMRTYVAHELRQRASNKPTRPGRRLPLAAGLWRLRTTRWRIALSSATLGMLAIALALEHVASSAPHTTTTEPSRLQEILAASWTAPYTVLSGAAATAAQTACVSAFNASPDNFPQTSYAPYDHISDSTILKAAQQGQIIVVTLAAGPDLLNCFEFPADGASQSWKAYPNGGAGPGLTDSGVVVPAWDSLASLPKGVAMVLEDGMQYTASPPPQVYSDPDRPTIDYQDVSVAPNVAKVTIEITNLSTGTTQDVSESPAAGAVFFWWPPQEGRLTKVIAYAANGRILDSQTVQLWPMGSSPLPSKGSSTAK